MKKIAIILFLLTFALSANAQQTVSQEFLDDATKAFSLVVEQREAIANLQKQVESLQKLSEELTRQKATPCSIAQEKVRLDSVFWLDRYEKADEGSRKQVEKVLKQTLKLGKSSIESQCGFQTKSAFSSVWDILKTSAPIAAAILIAR